MESLKIARDALRRVRNTLARAVVSGHDDAPGMQTLALRILAGETRRAVERVQQYGFTSRPHDGAEAVVLFPNGTRDHALVVAVDDRRYRMHLGATGEVAIHDDRGQHVHIRRDGIRVEADNIHLTSPGTIRIDGARVELRGGEYLQTEVHGKGSRETWTGGTAYRTDGYTNGATDGGSAEHGLDQPDLPSTHPDANA